MFQLRGPDPSEHRGPFEPHQHTWDTAAGDAGHDDTQHPAHSEELGLDICLAVQRVQRLHSLGAGLSAVPAISVAPAVPAPRIGEQRRRRGEQ